MFGYGFDKFGWGLGCSVTASVYPSLGQPANLHGVWRHEASVPLDLGHTDLWPVLVKLNLRPEDLTKNIDTLKSLGQNLWLLQEAGRHVIHCEEVSLEIRVGSYSKTLCLRSGLVARERP